MTDKSPEILATANLTPVSPAPLHPSSPIIVPALQDQADTFYAMSLHNSGQFTRAPAPAVEQVEATNQSDMPITNGHGGTHVNDTASVHEYPDNNARVQVGEANLVGEEDGQTQHSDSLSDVTETQQDVSKTNQSTLSPDTSESLTNHSEVAAPHDLSSTSPVQPASQSAADPSPQTAQAPQEPQEPQEQAVTSTSTDRTVPVQPATEAFTDKSDRPSSAANDEIDIQSLVDKIIGNAPAGDAGQASASQNVATLPATLQTSSSLPPRPPMPQQPAQSHMRTEDTLVQQTGISYPNATAATSTIPPAPGTYSTDARSNLPPPPASSVNAAPTQPLPVPQYDAAYTAVAGVQPRAYDQSQRWDTFLQEERRYVSEAKWDRFPEGSRLFIGNLSSDRVSKKEVFDIFSKYGRLAQISLKQAYGFVQYHTVTEGTAAMDNLQGIEVRGRKIHLEFSRTQKRDGDGDKRGSRGKRDGDRHEGVRRRDDYRPGRQSSPRRGSHRQQDSYDSQSRPYYDEYNPPRGRSRSPGYGRRGSDYYRRRSPSPYRRHASEADLEIPRRYGGDIPDVQFLLLQEVERDFISWVERAFVNHGLKVQVMFLNPRFPRDAVIQRQVVEGVHAVAELDYRAQQSGKIPLQVFDRSAGRHNVRYDQYQDLDPNIAAQLVTRTKSQVQLQSPYSGQFPPAPQYPQATQHPYMPPSYHGQPYPGAGGEGGSGSIDGAALQTILGSLQSQQGVPQSLISKPGAGGPQVDVNALLASLGSNGAALGGAPLQQSMGYPPGGPVNGAPGAPGDSAHHVQNIMTQLSRYRQ
ncbi:hypothetical protein F4779DRAFT_279769 [Xylariaceae sp. FL0662B]|nr:hypothetical protein F4779DRAFT_279769 [Xylariaceae sp. FL0662B]